MKLKLYTRLAAVGAAALAPLQALAQNPFQTALNQANAVANTAGIQSQRTLPEIVGLIINILLGFLGIVFLVLLIYAGFLWMTAAGDKSKVEKAQDMIRQAIIGLVVIVAAFAISNFVLQALVNVSQ